MVNHENFTETPVRRLDSYLSFSFKEGACGSFIDKDDKEFALLCFDREHPTICYICTYEELINKKGASCAKIDSKPTNGVARNAISLGYYQG